MANTILLKRSGTDGSIPGSVSLSLGELAINTFNGRLFAKKDNGSVSVVDLTRNDPIRLLGDAVSTYAWDQSTYTSNVTVSLINSGVTAGTYGDKTVATIQNGGNIRIPTFQVHANGIIYSAGTVTISSSDFGTMAVQDSSSVNITGGSISGVSVQISGGDGTFGNVTVNGKLYSNDVTATDITADGNVTITGNLTVQGTQTIVNSTTVAVGDKNIVLAKDATDATQADGAGLTVIGPTTSATIVYDGVGDKWEFNKTVTLLADLDVKGGDITTNQTTFNLVNGTATTVNFAGAATAIEIGSSTGDTNINNNLVVDGDAQIKGGDLTTDQTTFNLLNTTATTVNFAGAATTIAIGSATGTTNINNNLDVNGNINIDGENLTSTTSTFNLVNTNSTTVNFAGAATTVEIGASTGTTTVNNNLNVDGDLQVKGGDLTTNQTTFNLVNGTATTVNFAGAATTVEIGASTGTTTINNDGQVDGNLTVTGLTTLNGGLSADGGKFTIADTTGDIHTDGNLDVDGSVTINTNLTIDGILYANGGVNFDTGAFTVANSTGDIHTSGNLDVDLDTTLNGTLTVDGVANLNGGITVDTNKFTVADATGNTYIDGTLDVKGDLTTNDVVANGVVFGDNVTGALTTDAEFTYTTATNTLTIANANVTTSLTVNDLTITGTTSMSSVTSSSVTATQVVYGGTGGAFKGEASFTYTEATDTLSVGNITVADDVAVNGGDLTTTAGTFNLVNTNATTVNFAGAATTVEIGASTGTTTINNNGQVDGTLNVTGNLSVDTNKFTVIASSGNVAVAGTLGVEGATTINNTLNVTGAATFANVVALVTANAQMTLNNFNTGTLRILGDASIDGDLQVSEKIYKGGYEVINTQDVIDGGTY